ncbi:MAG: DUF4411 family protein [Dehalococcoidia bacterium]|nr:DUF4411 family protein [Dehalococcoidia bacterium]
MPDFWLDTNSLIEPYRKYYCFDMVPNFWKFLEQKSKDGVIASPITVLDEIEDGCKNKGQPDELLIWARNQEGVLFLQPSNIIQQIFGQIAENVNNGNKSTPWRAQDFLRGADPWTIAYAKALGGRVVTFETKATRIYSKIKIPDVADQFGVECINLHKMLAELKARF